MDFFPHLQPGQYAVVAAETATGIVLNLDGKRHLGAGKAWLIFDSLEEAKKYANQKVLDFPDMECGIYNHLGNVVAVYKRH
jgi:hypothetical protein